MYYDLIKKFKDKAFSILLFNNDCFNFEELWNINIIHKDKN